MCTSAVITGVVSFILGFGLGRFLTWTKKEHKPVTKNDRKEGQSVLRIHIYG